MITAITANMNADEEMRTHVFYLSKNKDNSSTSDICHMTLKFASCSPYSLSDNGTSNGTQERCLWNSGLANILVDVMSDIRISEMNVARYELLWVMVR